MRASTALKLVEDRADFARAMRAKIRRRLPLEILLAEDDASDALLAVCALDETHIVYRLHRISGGADVLADLAKEAAFGHIPIIILSGEPDSGKLPEGAVWLSDYLPKPCSPMQIMQAFGKLHSPALN